MLVEYITNNPKDIPNINGQLVIKLFSFLCHKIIEIITWKIAPDAIPRNITAENGEK